MLAEVYAFTNLEEGTYKVRVRKGKVPRRLDQTEGTLTPRDNTSRHHLELNDPDQQNVNFGYIPDTISAPSRRRQPPGALNSESPIPRADRAAAR